MMNTDRFIGVSILQKELFNNISINADFADTIIEFFKKCKWERCIIFLTSKYNLLADFIKSNIKIECTIVKDFYANIISEYPEYEIEKRDFSKNPVYCSSVYMSWLDEDLEYEVTFKDELRVLCNTFGLGN